MSVVLTIESAGVPLALSSAGFQNWLGTRFWTVFSTPVLMSRSRSEEHTSELQSLRGISYAVFCLKKKKDEGDGDPAADRRHSGAELMGLVTGVPRDHLTALFFFFNDTATTEIYT